MTELAPSPVPEEALSALVRLGARLRAQRIAQGFTVADMCERAFCSPTTWRALEAGKPGARTGLLAQALWLLGALDGLEALPAAAAALPTARRVRRPSRRPAPGTIAPDELDF